MRLLRALTAILIGIALLAPLAACGKKAPPDPPPDKENRYPRTYPTR